MHERRYCGGIQTLANEGVNNLIRQMAIFNHKNKIYGKAKSYLLKFIAELKAPQPPESVVPVASAFSWFAFVVAIFREHENGGIKGQPRDDTCKECWMKQTLYKKTPN